MKPATLRNGASTGGVSGTARVDRRTKDLLRRLHPGDVAIIDAVDLDYATAEALIAAQVAAVVNASASISGRYPNLGPQRLVSAGIPVLDEVGTAVFGAVRDGSAVRVHGDVLFRGDDEVCRGIAQTPTVVADAMARARAGLSSQLRSFAANTAEVVKLSRPLLLEGVGIPATRTAMHARHVVVVSRSYSWAEDLAGLKRYLREYRPVLIGVDAGASALRESGYTPDLIVGDVDTVADATLRCGAEVVVRVRPDGRSPAWERVQDLGVPAMPFPMAGSSECAALLLADAGGAQVIVTVGSSATLEEFLDNDSPGMASTFLSRLRVAGKLVDARAMRRLYRPQVSAATALGVVVAAAILIGLILAFTDTGQSVVQLLTGKWHSLTDWIRGLMR